MGVLPDLKKASNPPDLELQIAVSHYVCVGN